MRAFLKLLVSVEILFGLIFLLPFSTFGLERVKISFAKLPVAAESAQKGVNIDLFKAISKASGIPVEINVVPFARSMDNVIKGRADLHMPLIKSPYHKTAPPYDYSTDTIYNVNFVLYTNKNKPVSGESLKTAKLETDRAHVGYFPFAIDPSSCIECSLKKVNVGRIDGFIFADSVTDPLVKKNNLTNIRRELYRQYEVKIILPKGQKGGEVDQWLSKSLMKLRESGEFQSIMKLLDIEYNNWQP